MIQAYTSNWVRYSDPNARSLGCSIPQPEGKRMVGKGKSSVPSGRSSPANPLAQRRCRR